MLFNERVSNQSFTKWLLNSRESRLLLLLSFIVIIFQFIVFKIAYPYPNFFPDSYDYIATAIENRSISYRPIGYSKFLRIVHFFSSSHLVLIAVQYILLQLTLVYLIFSIGYLFAPGKWTLRILLMCCITNPLVYHLSNLVSSDGLFTTLSLIWLTQLLRILSQPGRSLIISHGIILLLAFAVRYNALYYPLISIAVILSSQTTTKTKLIGIAFTLTLLGSFVIFTMLQFKKTTGVAQFAPFNGWITVVNALSVYYHIDSLDAPKSIPPKFQQLHQLVNKYVDSLYHIKHKKKYESASFFMWRKQSPLYQYLGNKLTLNYYSHPDFKQWVAIAPFYEEYGLLLIKKHPALYLKHHISKNLLTYNSPWIEYLGLYETWMGQEIQDWFETKSYTKSEAPIPQIKIIKYISLVHGFINPLLPLLFSTFLITTISSKKRYSRIRLLNWMMFIWISALAFTIVASYPSFRYLAFQFVLTFILDVLILDQLIKSLKPIKIATDERLTTVEVLNPK